MVVAIYLPDMVVRCPECSRPSETTFGGRFLAPEQGPPKCAPTVGAQIGGPCLGAVLRPPKAVPKLGAGRTYDYMSCSMVHRTVVVQITSVRHHRGWNFSTCVGLVIKLPIKQFVVGRMGSNFGTCVTVVVLRAHATYSTASPPVEIHGM